MFNSKKKAEFNEKVQKMKNELWAKKVKELRAQYSNTKEYSRNDLEKIAAEQQMFNIAKDSQIKALNLIIAKRAKVSKVILGVLVAVVIFAVLK